MNIIRLQEQVRVWRLRFYAACAAFGGLFVLSLVQFSSTFLTCRVLHETRETATELNQESIEVFQRIREAQRRTEEAARQAEAWAATGEARVHQAATSVQQSQAKIVMELLQQRTALENDVSLLDKRLANDLQKLDILDTRQKLEKVENVWDWHVQQKQQMERRQSRLQALDEQIEELREQVQELIAEKETLQQMRHDLKYHPLPGPIVCPAAADPVRREK